MQWQAALQQATELRHWFHQNPELTWEERNTAEKIRQCLTEWEIEWRECANFGTVAVIAADSLGKNIALRADMDALPITETAEVDYISQVSGKMHACGHDGHMAALLGTALWLKYHEANLPNKVTLIFQPAEEGGHGALKMIEDGALDGVDEIYGWHNWPVMKMGTAVCPDGPVMSGNASFKIVIDGEGGHASQPEACRDPVIAAAAITLNCQQIISRRLPPQAAAVISVTQMQAGTTPNIIPQTVELGGTIRFSEPRWRTEVSQHLEQVAQDTAKSYGVSATVEIEPFYDATINHPEAAQHFREVLQTQLGDHYDQVNMHLPIMGAEDFSYYLQKVPGAFALIGMSEEDSDENGSNEIALAENSKRNAQGTFCAPCHSPNYVFNDALLDVVMRSFSKIVGAPVK